MSLYLYKDGYIVADFRKVAHVEKWLMLRHEQINEKMISRNEIRYVADNFFYCLKGLTGEQVDQEKEKMLRSEKALKELKTKAIASHVGVEIDKVRLLDNTHAEVE